MTCSSSSSASALRAAALALALLAPAAAGAADAAPSISRVALYPIENASGVAAPLRELMGRLETALARRGIEVVSGEAVNAFLERHRIRHTGAVDPLAARAVRDELAVDGIVVTVLEQYQHGPPPRLSVTMRLVTAGDAPSIAWIDGVGLNGGGRPGLLGLGLVSDLAPLEALAVDALATSLSRTLAGGGPRAPRCVSDATFRPRIPYRSTYLTRTRNPLVVVLPFVNHTRSRAAGDLLALAFVRGLAGVERFRLMEPGALRDLMLRYRVILQGGVNLDQARTLLGALEADLIVTGEVFDHDDPGTPAGLKLDFSVTALDGRTGAIAWQSRSYNRGDDGQTLFKLGAVHTAHEVTCRMVGAVVDGMTALRPPPPR